MHLKTWNVAPLTELARKMFAKKFDRIKTRACYGCKERIPAGRSLCDTCFNQSKEVKHVNPHK